MEAQTGLMRKKKQNSLILVEAHTCLTAQFIWITFTSFYELFDA